MRPSLRPSLFAVASVALAILLMPVSSEAANFAALPQPTTLANLILLLAAGFCGYLAFQLWNLVRGGQMSTTWQLFLAAFSLLAVVQLLTLLNALEIAAIPGWIILILSAGMVAAFVFALTQSRRTLG